MAWVVDAVPYFLVPYVVGRLTGSTALGIAAFLIVGILWSIVPEARGGVTVGKLLAGIRVEPGDGTVRIGLGHSAVRWFVKYVVCSVLPVGYLWYFRDPRRRAWQDLAGGSIVIDVASGRRPG